MENYISIIANQLYVYSDSTNENGGATCGRRHEATRSCGQTGHQMVFECRSGNWGNNMEHGDTAPQRQVRRSVKKGVSPRVLYLLNKCEL